MRIQKAEFQWEEKGAPSCRPREEGRPPCLRPLTGDPRHTEILGCTGRAALVRLGVSGGLTVHRELRQQVLGT